MRPAPEPTNGSAVSQRLLQLVDQRGRGTDDRTNQLAFFRKCEVEGNLCRGKSELGSNQICFSAAFLLKQNIYKTIITTTDLICGYVYIHSLLRSGNTMTS